MRVLMLTPWPIVRFAHGGQLRAAAIAAAYRARGHAVTTAAPYDPALTSDVGADDYAVPSSVAGFVSDAESHSEMALWGALSRMPDALDWYTATVARVRPALLQFEEPYLWPVVRALQARGVLDGVPIVHSSYNYETEAKRQIRASGARVRAQTLSDMAALERGVAQGVDAVVTVSDGDAAAFRAMGATRVVIAPNGHDPWPADAHADAALADYTQGEPFALFVSSAHPPNAYGLVELAAATRRHLNTGALLVCGGVSGLLRDMPEFAENRHIFARARLLGVVSPGLLGAMTRAARVITLPKTRGAGSNLKTAEALLSGRPVVATPGAFTGYERYTATPGVIIEPDSARFWHHVADALATPLPPPPDRTPAMTAGLRWAECLTPMMELAEALAAGG